MTSSRLRCMDSGVSIGRNANCMLIICMIMFIVLLIAIDFIFICLLKVICIQIHEMASALRKFANKITEMSSISATHAVRLPKLTTKIYIAQLMYCHSLPRHFVHLTSYHWRPLLYKRATYAEQYTKPRTRTHARTCVRTLIYVRVYMCVRVRVRASVCVRVADYASQVIDVRRLPLASLAPPSPSPPPYPRPPPPPPPNLVSRRRHLGAPRVDGARCTPKNGD